MIIVGTTNFDELVKAIDKDEIFKILINFGFTHIIFQIGKYISQKIFIPKFVFLVDYTPPTISLISKIFQLKFININPHTRKILNAQISSLVTEATKN